MTRATKQPIKPIHALVGFIDILGFSHKVRSAKTAQDLQAIADAVRLVQREFEATPSGSTPDVRAIHRLHAKRVLAFSDCVVISIGMRSAMTRHEGTYDPLMMQVCGLAYSQGACVLRGIFLRGGLELGWWWSRQSVLVSSALAAAYDRAETGRRACPRIGQRTVQPPEATPAPRVLRTVLRFFRQHHRAARRWRRKEASLHKLPSGHPGIPRLV